MSKEKRLRSNLRMAIVSAIILVITLTVIINYTSVQNNEVRSQTKYILRKNTHEIALLIDSSIADARSSIQVTSTALSNQMTDERLENPAEIIAAFLPNTAFDDIEYIYKDGMNYTNSGAPFDASAREYFKEGIQGRTGIWVNFTPKYSTEPLLNFYTPLYYEDTIAGVITGTIGGNSNLTQKLMEDYCGQPVAGLVLDENNRIIASSEPFELGMYLTVDNLNVRENDKQLFLDAISAADETPFELEGDKGKSIGVVGKAKLTGWRVIHIIPSVSIDAVTSKSDRAAFIAIATIMVTSLVLLVMIILEIRKRSLYNLMKIRDEAAIKEESLFMQSNTDELTGLGNRRAYEEAVSKYISSPVETNLVYVSMDVNGLKKTNDTVGHAAGDELIVGAAACMNKAFGYYGQIFRTGGDEFAALLLATEEECSQIKHDFDEILSEWSGTLIRKLSVSSGYVERREFPDKTIMELSRIADKRMYQAKSDYYKKNGIDRRGGSAALAALCAQYSKVLKINLTTDTYQIVHMSKDEQNSAGGFASSLSEWIDGFYHSDYIHPGDAEEFHRRLDLETARNYFKEGHQTLSVSYRRKSPDGEYRDCRLEIIASEDYKDEDQNLFLYVKVLDR